MIDATISKNSYFSRPLHNSKASVCWPRCSVAGAPPSADADCRLIPGRDRRQLQVRLSAVADPCDNPFGERSHYCPPQGSHRKPRRQFAQRSEAPSVSSEPKGRVHPHRNCQPQIKMSHLRIRSQPIRTKSADVPHVCSAPALDLSRNKGRLAIGKPYEDRGLGYRGSHEVCSEDRLRMLLIDSCFR